MYLHVKRDPRLKKRGKSSRHKAKAAAKNRRRVQGMHGRPVGRRIRRNAA